LLFVKGAPERVAAMCNEILTADGPACIDPGDVQRVAGEMAGRGLRILALAYRVLEEAPFARHDLPEPSGLVFLGMEGMLDPPREGVREAIAGCQGAGMRVLMITGDHARTALAIGRDLGIAAAGAQVLSGADLNGMDDEALDRAVARVAVFARVAPEQKLRIVHALRRRGEVVAVTGDGVNDAPALKAADIGIAMGRSGTDVAREAADMVLADDNFISIYAAVEEGRVTFDNVRKVTFFLVSTGAAGVVTIITALLLGWPLPLLATQLLWLNLVTNGLQDVALAFEPGEPDVLQRPPRSQKEGILSRLLWERTALAGVVMAAGTLALFRWELDRPGSSLAAAQTVALTTMVLFQVFHVGNSRSERQSILRRSPLSNPFLFVSTAAALSVHVGALYFPPTQFILRVEPIELEAWVRIVLIAASVLAAVEVHKRVRR
jgi:Ca2+-transporting ATPase